MAKTIAKLNIQLGASSGALTKDLTAAGGTVRRFDTGVRKAAGGMNVFTAAGAKMRGGLTALTARLRGAAGQLLAVAAAAATAVIGVRGIVNAFKGMDEVAKTSRKLGVATEELIGLRLAASEFSGIGATQFDTALQRMTRRIAEAAAGTGEAQGAIRELGLNAQQLNLAGPAEAFRQIAGAMSGVDNQSDRLRLAFKLFDSEGAGLVTTLSAGRGAIEEVQRSAEQLGATFSAVDAAQIEAANDAIGRMKQAFGGVAQQLAIALAPAVEEIANALAGFAKELAQTIKLARPAIQEFALGVAESIGNLIRLLTKALKLLNSLLEKLNPDKLRKLSDFAARATMPLTGVPRLVRGESLGGAVGEVDTLADSFGGLADEIEGASGAMKDWTAIGKQLTEEVRTPLEQYQAKIEDIRAALEAGAITWETFRRHAERAVGELVDAERSKRPDRPAGVPAAVVGTAEGYTSVMEGMARLNRVGSDQQLKRDANRRLEELLASIDGTLKRMSQKEPIQVRTVRM